MKRVLFFMMLITLSGISNAQERSIARGAIEGEMYMAIGWYANYYEAQYSAILHVTENGKKVEMNYTMQIIEPDTWIADSLPMQAYFIMADATPGAVYIADWCYDTEAYPNDRLWFSDNYGKTWELRDTQIGQKYYYVANNEGIIYRGGGGVYKSTNFALDFFKEDGISYWVPCDPGLLLGEVFSAGAMIPYQGKLTHTYNDFKTYTQIAIDSQYIHGWPDVFRGGLPGEVYIASGPFPDNIYKVSFSSDTGYHFRVVYERKGYMEFMSDRKAGDFYIVTQQVVETQQPWGYYGRVCIEYYTDYGETLVGTYCHDLTREGVVTAIDEQLQVTSYELQVYPNPTSGEIVVSTEYRVESIEIFDLLGKLVFIVETLRATSLQFDISHLPAGMYFMRIQTETSVITKKVVKQ